MKKRLGYVAALVLAAFIGAIAWSASSTQAQDKGDDHGWMPGGSSATAWPDAHYNTWAWFVRRKAGHEQVVVCKASEQTIVSCGGAQTLPM
jgi:hypothetical protein